MSATWRWSSLVFGIFGINTHWSCHPERSEGSLAFLSSSAHNNQRCFAPLNMTRLDQLPRHALSTLKICDARRNADFREWYLTTSMAARRTNGPCVLTVARLNK